jgi:hypothetical protein
MGLEKNIVTSLRSEVHGITTQTTSYSLLPDAQTWIDKHVFGRYARSSIAYQGSIKNHYEVLIAHYSRGAI